MNSKHMQGPSVELMGLSSCEVASTGRDQYVSDRAGTSRGLTRDWKIRSSWYSAPPVAVISVVAVHSWWDSMRCRSGCGLCLGWLLGSLVGLPFTPIWESRGQIVSLTRYRSCILAKWLRLYSSFCHLLGSNSFRSAARGLSSAAVAFDSLRLVGHIEQRRN
jgi:hypothetical protein